jgi:hypothetical protein
MSTREIQPDPFDEVLARHMGPASVEAPPPALRQAVLVRVALLPDPALLRRRDRLRWANGLALLFLALALAWVMRNVDSSLSAWWAGLARDSLQLGAGDWRQGLELLLGSGWWAAARNPLVLGILSLLLLPLFYYLLEER